MPKPPLQTPDGETDPIAAATARLVIDGGAATTIWPKAPAVVTVHDVPAGVTPTQMRFTVNGSVRDWIDYARETRVGLTDAYGAKAVEVDVRLSNGSTVSGSDGIELVAAARTTLEVRQSYRFVVTANPDTSRFWVTETLTLTNDNAAPIDHLNLSVLPRGLGMFYTRTGLAVDGRAIPWQFTNKTNLRIPLGRNLEPAETTVVTVPFALYVTANSGPFSGRINRGNGVTILGNWAPILSTDHDIWQVGNPQVSVDADRVELLVTTTRTVGRWAVAGPGVATRPSSAGTKFRFVATHVRDIGWSIAPAYKVTAGTASKTTVRVHYVRGDGARALALAKQAVARYEARYGTFPYQQFTIAESPGNGHAMEWPGYITLSADGLSSPLLVYHEIAHQYFYSHVGNDQMHDPWVDEGFAEFASRRALGLRISACAWTKIDVSVFSYTDYKAAWTTSCNSYFQTVYWRAAQFLDKTRVRLGDTAFYAAMRRYIAAHPRGLAYTGDVVYRLRQSSGALEALFDEYISEAGQKQRAPAGLARR